jgi:hypothetical protein
MNQLCTPNVSHWRGSPHIHDHEHVYVYMLVIDEQKGLAVGFSNFYHDSKLKTAKLKGIPGMESVPSYQGLFNMPAIHFFKIKRGKIYDIEATGLVQPYGSKTGWE